MTFFSFLPQVVRLSSSWLEANFGLAAVFFDAEPHPVSLAQFYRAKKNKKKRKKHTHTNKHILGGRR